MPVIKNGRVIATGDTIPTGTNSSQTFKKGGGPTPKKQKNQKNTNPNHNFMVGLGFSHKRAEKASLQTPAYIRYIKTQKTFLKNSKPKMGIPW